MRKTVGCLLLWIVLFTLTGSVLADRGQIWPSPVRLAEEAQKAVVMHNRNEEILILGTELKADRSMGILEFIPFPSRPAVSLAEGNPFVAVQELISRKKIQFEEKSRGGSAAVSVEIEFTGRLGLHDVTIVRINELAGFSKWVTGFFKRKGIQPENGFDGVYANAGDYLERGYRYFVFDYVQVAEEGQSFEPLLYRFKTDTLYYPLKTSNITGGEGMVDLVLVLPGSLGLLIDRCDVRKIGEVFRNGVWDLSSSSKVYPDELKTISPKAERFFKTGKPYMQVVQYYGRYNFPDDLTLDVSIIPPFAYKHIGYMPDYHNYSNGGEFHFLEPLTRDEKKDIAEAYAQKKPNWYFDPKMVEAMGELNNERDNN